MTSFNLSSDARSDVLRRVQSLGVGVRDAFVVSRALCDRIEASVSVYRAEVSGNLGAGQASPALRSLALRLTQEDPSDVEVRDLITALPPAAVEQIESRALRLADQVPACATVGSDLLGWSKIAPTADPIPVLRLCAFAWLRVALWFPAKCALLAANLYLILNLLCSVVGARFQDCRSSQAAALRMMQRCG